MFFEGNERLGSDEKPWMFICLLGYILIRLMKYFDGNMSIMYWISLFCIGDEEKDGSFW